MLHWCINIRSRMKQKAIHVYILRTKLAFGKFVQIVQEPLVWVLAFLILSSVSQVWAFSSLCSMYYRWPEISDNYPPFLVHNALLGSQLLFYTHFTGTTGETKRRQCKGEDSSPRTGDPRQWTVGKDVQTPKYSTKYWGGQTCIKTFLQPLQQLIGW